MTLVRFNNKPGTKSFNNLMDDFFTTVPSLFRDDLGAAMKHSAPVNIKETETGYELELIAPGFEREDFKIDLDKNNLTISAERKKTEQKENERQVKSEYRYQSFNRSFTIDENIDAENIAAKYLNGVLVLNLPKKPEVKASVKQISIQ